MPNINLNENDTSNYSDQQFIKIAYNGSVNLNKYMPETLNYTVKFIFDNDLYYMISVRENQKVSAPSVAPAKEGYTFKHWNLDDEEFDFDTIITSNIILKSEFEENANLTRNAANCSVAVTVDGSTVEDGERVLEIGSTATITATADAGYTLASLKVNGEAFTSGSTLEVDGDVIIEAVAEKTSESSGYTWNGTDTSEKDISDSNYMHWVADVPDDLSKDELIGSTIVRTLNGENTEYTVDEQNIDGESSDETTYWEITVGEHNSVGIYKGMSGGGIADGVYLNKVAESGDTDEGMYTSLFTLAE